MRVDHGRLHAGVSQVLLDVLSEDLPQGVSPMWLVDGQQRTRAMLGIFQQMLTVPTVDGWSLVRKADLDSLIGIRDAVSGDPTADDRTGIRPGDPRREAVLQQAVGADTAGLYPEKQHIVPFASGRQIAQQ